MVEELPSIVSRMVGDVAAPGDEVLGEFMAPAAADVIDGLVAQYRAMRAKIEAMARLACGEEYRGALYYFIEGNTSADRRSSAPSVSELFRLEGALAKLNAQFWQKALEVTDVYEFMPQKRRDEWNEQLRYPEGVRKNRGLPGEPPAWAPPPLPDFEEATVRETLAGLLASRSKFLAERVDGIFSGLSGAHVTNRPEGFGKRMIISYVLDVYGGVNYSKAGLIGDLRAVIAKFMGRDEPRHKVIQRLLLELRKATGEWHTVDGGALRIRVYKNGNAHLEVHPDMAWRLNQVLAYLYPLAIPAQFRQRPKKRVKDFTLMQRPLPFAVLTVLAETGYRHEPGKVYHLAYDAPKKGRAYVEACQVLELLGGVAVSPHEFEFDYVPDAVIEQVILTGCVPDRRAHQFFPTPRHLASQATEWAEIGPQHSVLEPSAGRGDLAIELPIERTTCVEVAALQCEILRSKGFRTVHADFLAWAEAAQREGVRFDRVVMNPPFSDGRAALHVEAAAALLREGGVLVAILPASMRGKDVLSGFHQEWSKVHEGEFAGTSVSVVMLKARRR